MFEPGVTLFCSHHWERPLYNKQLNLRDGLEKCQKCNSVRGYKRFVPLPDMEPEEYENEYSYDSPNIGLRIVSAFIPLIIMVIVVRKIGPMFFLSFTSLTTNITASGEVSNASASLFMLIPLIGIAIVVIFIFSTLSRMSVIK